MKTSQKKEKLALRAEPPKTTHINKPVLLIVGGVLLFIVVLAFVEAFRVSDNRQTHDNIAQSALKDTTPTVTSAFKNLPQSYTEVSSIKKYLGESDSKPIIKIPDAVKQEISSLQNQQQFLQQQLATLRTQKQQSYSQDNVENQQAKTSGLFFPGVAPPRNEPKNDTKSTTASSDTGSGSGGSKQNSSAYEKQNMQQQKMDFLKPDKDAENIYDKHSLVKPLSPYEIQAGTIIPATLLSGINTTLPGDVVAQVTESIFDSVSGQFLLVPKGSKLLGKYDSQISYGQERVLIVFYRIIRPDGSSILLQKSAGTDLLGEAGMQGNVNNHWARVIGAATLSTLLSIGAGVASDNTGRNNTYYRSASQNAYLGAAGAIASTGQDLTNRAINIQPTLTIPAGYEFNVIVNKDMILSPFSTGTVD